MNASNQGVAIFYFKKLMNDSDQCAFDICDQFPDDSIPRVSSNFSKPRNFLDPRHVPVDTEYRMVKLSKI